MQTQCSHRLSIHYNNINIILVLVVVFLFIEMLLLLVRFVVKKNFFLKRIFVRSKSLLKYWYTMQYYLLHNTAEVIQNNII